MSAPATELPPSNGSAIASPATPERKPLTKKEIVADHPTWCPGCGDFSVLALYFKLIEKRKFWQEKITTISGIGCSSRFPYFVQAYGAHYIHGRALPFAYNRKEAKDHGEGGIIVGAHLRGRTVIVDDVITDGASKRESVELIRHEGAKPVAVLIALDRMERGGIADNLSAQSAVMDFERDHGLPVLAIATVADLLEFLNSDADSAFTGYAHAVARYRERYGV